MAGEPATELEARINEIDEALSLWTQLADNDKKKFKALIDQKVGSLADYVHDKDIKKFTFLKRALELQKAFVAAGFDLGTVKSLISKEIERLLLQDGVKDENARLTRQTHLFTLH